MRFKDQVVWITGASSGIGEGLAQVFHREGAELILSARREAELERVKAECSEGPGAVHVLPFDVVDADAREAAYRRVHDIAGRVDILVNNAGISQRSLGKDTDMDVDRRIMEVDYFAPIALTKLVLPEMIARKSGQLVVTSSVAGKYGIQLRSAYCAAKHALHGYFDTMRLELTPYNIRVCLLVIAGIRSEVSLHALTGNGGTWGKEDWGPNDGMSAIEGGKIIVDGLAAGKYEIDIGVGQAMDNLRLKREAPDLLIERMAKMKVPGQ
ncbi:MAG: SDR family NAD(P)-dependent oxidoreductase [Alphaproteobacteria bacterium]